MKKLFLMLSLIYSSYTIAEISIDSVLKMTGEVIKQGSSIRSSMSDSNYNQSSLQIQKELLEVQKEELRLKKENLKKEKWWMYTHSNILNEPKKCKTVSSTPEHIINILSENNVEYDVVKNSEKKFLLINSKSPSSFITFWTNSLVDCEINKKYFSDFILTTIKTEKRNIASEE